MITDQKDSFYILNASGEVAETLISAFSDRVLKDIESITVLSKLFDNDIEPINELSNSIDFLKEAISPGFKESSEFNPLYFPTSEEAIDDVLDPLESGNGFRFSGMNGNPFAIMSKNVNDKDDGLLIHSLTCYRQFDLPSYDELKSDQKTFLLN